MCGRWAFLQTFCKIRKSELVFCCASCYTKGIEQMFWHLASDFPELKTLRFQVCRSSVTSLRMLTFRILERWITVEYVGLQWNLLDNFEY